MTMYHYEYRNFIYNKERSFVFAYVPKAACTNWKCLMRFFERADDWLDSDIAHDPNLSGLTLIAPIANAPNSGLPTGARRFAMVRNPYARALSAYLNKIDNRIRKPRGNSNDYWNQLICDLDSFKDANISKIGSSEITFEKFLFWLAAGKSNFVKDEHWVSQAKLLRCKYIKFDYIGRFENIEEDSKQIIDLMGGDARFPTQREVNFPSNDTEAKLDAYLSDQSTKMIEDIFWEDFVNFGYTLRSGRNVNEIENRLWLRSLARNEFFGLSKLFRKNRLI